MPLQATHFLQQAAAGEGFYWSATTHSSAYQLRSFSRELYAWTSGRALSETSPELVFADWEAALGFLGEELARRPAQPQLIILDEFTYLVRNDPPVTSVFQKVWDHRLAKLPNLKLVLTGSLVGMMEREVLSYKAPLYGRATAQFKLRPLPYAALVELFSKRTPAERVAISR